MGKNPISKTGLVIAATMFLACFGRSFGQAGSIEGTTPTAANLRSASEILPDSPAPSAVSGSDPSASEFESVFLLRADPGRRAGPAPTLADLRFHRFLKRSFDSSAVCNDLLDAAQAHFQRAWPQYGPGVVGFEKRFGSVVAGHVTSDFFNTYFFPTVLHQDPHSPRLGPGASAWRRAGYAISRVVITRDDTGRETFNSSLLLSAAASSAASNLYLPHAQRGVAPSFERLGSSLIGASQDNLTREFSPDIKKLISNHIPYRLRHLPVHRSSARD